MNSKIYNMIKSTFLSSVKQSKYYIIFTLLFTIIILSSLHCISDCVWVKTETRKGWRANLLCRKRAEAYREREEKAAKSKKQKEETKKQKKEQERKWAEKKIREEKRERQRKLAQKPSKDQRTIISIMTNILIKDTAIQKISIS
ncbi:MAG: hypothetical protein OEZ13_13255 [Spirochaetia bacterium]|nr:hypothetical protein [Spirochaetia bacterium]